MKQKIVNAALDLAVSQGWEYTTLRDIALHAGVSLSALYSVIEDKNDILVILGRMIDKTVMESIDLSAPDAACDSMRARDRLFDLMMERYEALNVHRAGICAILESFRYDPKQMLISSPHLCRSMSWMLEAAGIETAGIKGALKVAGLTGVYIKVLRIWMKDESKDLSKTMSALDKTLERAESMANMFGF